MREYLDSTKGRGRRQDGGNLVARIKAAAPLLDYVGQFVALKVRGKDHVGCCPFHREKTPSFHVDETRFHCFGCGAHGSSVIDFVMGQRKITAREAISTLAAEFSIRREVDRPSRAAASAAPATAAPVPLQVQQADAGAEFGRLSAALQAAEQHVERLRMRAHNSRQMTRESASWDALAEAYGRLDDVRGELVRFFGQDGFLTLEAFADEADWRALDISWAEAAAHRFRTPDSFQSKTYGIQCDGRLEWIESIRPRRFDPDFAITQRDLAAAARAACDSGAC